MQKLSISLIIIILFLILSCNNENPVESGIDYSNSDLETQLAHYSYFSQQYYVQFFPDGTFIQKQFADRNNIGIFVVLYERTGKYELEDSLIKLSDVKVNYDTSLGGISIIWSDQEVSLVNGKISFKAVTILNAENNKNELWNYWKTIKLSYHYNDAINATYTGREEYFYEFISSNPKVRWGYDLIDGSPWPPSEYNSDYTYSPPLLYLFSENYQVEFKHNKMYWYYEHALNKSIPERISTLPLYPESIHYK